MRCSDLLPASEPLQLTVFDDTRDKLATLDKTVDTSRRRFGHFCIQRAAVSADRPLGGIDPKGDHVIHPVGFFRDGMLK